MEVKANKSLYQEVPVEAETCNVDISQSHTKSTKTNSDFVTAFLKRQGHEQRVKDTLEEDLQYKHYFLDNTGIHKKRKFDRRPGKRKLLPCAEKKRLKVFDIDPSQQKYSMFVPLHRLWTDYINDLIPPERLCAQNKSGAEQQLLRADYHGAIITVTRSKCPSLIGATGIVIQETRNVFRLITKDDRVKTIPKENTVFTIHHAKSVFTIYGNHFRVRTSDRVSKKFKSKSSIDL